MTMDLKIDSLPMLLIENSCHCNIRVYFVFPKTKHYRITVAVCIN